MNDDTPLWLARVELEEKLKDGKLQTCELCRGKVKIYHRGINAGIAWGLIWMYRNHGQDWCRFLSSGAARWSKHMASAAYWGLIEEYPGKRPDGGKGKAWRLTDEGVAYVLGERRCVKTKMLLHGEVIDEEGPRLVASRTR